MNKFLVGTLTAGVLTTLGVASRATDITYELLVGATAYSTPPNGAPASAESPGQTIKDYFVPNGPATTSFGTPSVLVYGDDVTTPGNAVAGTGAMWNMVPISIKFMVDVGGSISPTAQLFTATGVMNGMVGYSMPGDAPQSEATVTWTAIKDNTTGASAVASHDPNNTLAALEMVTIINKQPVDFWLDTVASKAAPGQSLNDSGYIMAPAVAIPEPGTLAMIVGAVVSGGVFLRRKRRA